MNHQNQSGACKICTNKNTIDTGSIICSLNGRQVEPGEWCESFVMDDGSSHRLKEFSFNADKEFFSQKLLNLFAAYLICLFAGVIIFGFKIFKGTDQPAMISVIGSLLLVASTVLSMILLYNLWAFTVKESKIQGTQNSVGTPGRAVGYLFIPFYNFYWLFKAIGSLPVDLNKISVDRMGKRIMPNDMGIVISIFTLISVIPPAALTLGVFNSLILLPFFFYTAIRAINNLPYGREKALPKQPQVPTLEIGSIRDYSQLFDKEKYGSNILFGVYIFLAVLCITIFSAIVEAFFGSFSFVDYITSYLIFFANQLLFILLLLVFSHTINNKLILALLTGLSNVVVNLVIMLPYYVLHYHIEIQQLLGNQFLYQLGTSFIFGFLLIICTAYSISLFGLKFRNILLASSVFIIIHNLIWYGINYFFTDNFQFRWTHLASPVLSILFYSLAIYFSFYQYVMRTQTHRQSIVPDNGIIDSDIN